MKKPYKTFPLTPHKNGQWVKKFKGDSYYFGPVGNPEAALKRFDLEWPEIIAGRPQCRASQAVTVLDVANFFLAHCLERMRANDMSAVAYGDYKTTCQQIADTLGKGRQAVALTPADFNRLRLHVRAKYAPSRVTKFVTVTRMMFKHAVEYDHIDKLPKYGPEFKGAKTRDKRLHRAASQKKLLTRDEVQALIACADQQWKAILLVCMNCGFGNSDIARVRTTSIENGYMSLVRGKTGIDRTVPLWPETVEAIQKLDRVGDRILFTSSRGTPLIRDRKGGGLTNLASTAFRRIAEDAGIYRHGLGLYWLRHTFQTIGEETKDVVAVASIMGHADHSMSAVYREDVSMERLQAVVDHVRKWLFSTTNGDRPH